MRSFARSVPTTEMRHSISLQIHGQRERRKWSDWQFCGTHDIYENGGIPLKNTNKKKMMKDTPDMLNTMINGMEVTLVFAEREDPDLKERIIDIITDEYKKKKLGKTPIAKSVKTV